MNLKRMKALLLTLIMVCSVVMLCACGKKDGETQSTDGGNQSGTAVYTVKLVDVLGNPFADSIVVIFLQNGEQVAMQPVNAEGTVSKELPKGQYDVELQFTKDAEKYHYASESLQVTAENTNLEIVISNAVGADYDVLSVNNSGRNVYKLVFTPANAEGTEGSFVLEDLFGDLDGTYLYAANEDYGYDVTNEAGEPVDMLILINLDGSFAFQAGYMTSAQQMVQEGDATEILSGTYNVVSTQYIAPYVQVGGSHLELNASERNYFIFVPTQSGIYEFTVLNATATVGYYGSPFFVQPESSGNPTGEQSMTIEVKDGMIGTGNTGTAQLVIGIDAEAGNESCIFTVVRIGDSIPTPEEREWTNYNPTYIPSKYTLPEGLTIQEFDLTAASDAYSLVFNEADGYYHLGTADGPVVLVRMDGALSFGGSFGMILANANVGKFFYDEEGTFQYKELYNDCLLQYLGTLNKGMGTYSYTDGKLDDLHNVYPLTKDLEYIIQSYGEYMGLWNSEDVDYLFGAMTGLNPDLAWLYMCCYAE